MDSMTEEKEEEEQAPLDEAFDIMESEYMKEDSSGILEFDREGALLGEKIFKIIAIESIESDDLDSDFHGDRTIEKFTLMRLVDDIFETIDKYEGEDKAEKKIALDSSDDVLLFFTLSNEIIRSLSGEILNKKIVDESLRSESSLSSMNNLDPKTQENLLYYSGAIDSGLKGEIVRVRKTRNKLVHDLRQRHLLSGLNNLESRIDRTVSTINNLYEAARGYEAFG